MLVFFQGRKPARRTNRRQLLRSAIFSEPLESRLLLASGLLATYYDNMDFTSPFATRVDPQVDFDWGTSSPVPHMGAETFSVKWTGQIQAPTSGAYTLSTFSDDGVRLKINGQTLIDHLVPQWPTEYSAPVSLNAGQSYSIELDFIQRYGESECHLSWEGPGIDKQIIPASALSPDAVAPSPDTTAPAVPGNLRITSTSDVAVSLAWDASSDNIGVSGYAVYNGSTRLAVLPPDRLSYTASALSPSTAYSFSIRALDAAGNLSQPASISATTTAPATTGHGLTGAYFDNMDFSSPFLTRVDPTVDFNWITGSPAPHMSADTFSVKWTGQVQAPATGQYTFYTYSDDGVRLKINGQTLIDHLVPQWPTEFSSTISLTAGQKYDIELDFIERYGEAECHLSWSGPGISKQVIPSSALFSNTQTPPPPADTTAPTTPGNLRQTDSTDASIALAWDASSDNVGVTGYELVRNNTLIATLPSGQTTYLDSSLQPSTTYQYQLRAVDAAGNKSSYASLSATTAGLTNPNPTPVTANGDGLLGSYYPSMDLSGTPVTRVDPGVDFNWADNPPINGIGHDEFSVRWVGQVEAPTSENYTFYTSTDDGARLWIDNQLVIDHWVHQGETQYASAPISLVAGHKYDIRMEFFDRYNEAIAHLRWSSPSVPLQSIPSSYLYSPDWTAPPPVEQPPIPVSNQTGRPYKGTPFSVGQRIEAEDFDLGGEGVAFHDLTPGNANGNVYRNDGPDVEPNIIGGVQNGLDVGWIQAGEWLTYTINAPTAGFYNLDAAFGVVGFGGTFHVEVDGRVASGQVGVPATGHWHRMEPVRISGIGMSAGNHVLKIVFDTNGDNGTFANFDYLQLSSGSGAPGPDLQIKNHGEEAYTGAGTFSTDPNAQTRTQSTSFLPPVYHILLTNTSSFADSFVIRTASDNTPNWKFRVYAADDSGPGGPAEISAITQSPTGWTIGPIAPGASFAFRIDLGPSALALGGSADSATITATSVNDPARVDSVKAIARVSAIRLPEFQRRNFDDSGTYLLDLTNQGNFDSTYRLTATPAAGSTFKIFDAYWGGNDITAAVLNGTYSTPVLGHDGIRQLRVEVSGPGQPSVTLSAVSNEDSSQADNVTITKAPAKPGLSQFVIGAWGIPTWDMAAWKDRGINTLIYQQTLSGTVSIDSWSAAARANGLKYLRAPSSNITADTTDPNLLAWMQNDEPDINRTPLSDLQNSYNYWKSVDPNMPVVTNWAGSEVVDWNTGVTLNEYMNLLKTTDMGSSSVYPVTGWGRYDDLDIEGRALDRLEKWSQGQPQLAIIESADSQLTWLPSDIPGPTPDQFRYEVWDAVVHGAKGIGYFPYSFYPDFSFDNTSPEVAAEMKIQDARLADLGPALMAPTDPANFGIKLPAGLEGTWRLYNGKKYFIVFNTVHDTLSNQTMTLVNTPGTSATVEGENRTVAVNNGVITDTFGPYAMHAYVVG